MPKGSQRIRPAKQARLDQVVLGHKNQSATVPRACCVTMPGSFREFPAVMSIGCSVGQHQPALHRRVRSYNHRSRFRSPVHCVHPALFEPLSCIRPADKLSVTAYDRSVTRTNSTSKTGLIGSNILANPQARIEAMRRLIGIRKHRRDRSDSTGYIRGLRRGSRLARMLF